MVLEIKTYSPRSHIEVCSVINLTDSLILKSKFNQEDCYGYFLIESDPDFIDSFVWIDDSDVVWSEEL